jgi:hypothetical protein
MAFVGPCWQGEDHEAAAGPAEREEAVRVQFPVQWWDVVRAWGAQLASQDRALHNARRASTALLRRRVERDEVALYLDGLEEERDRLLTEPEGPAEPSGRAAES